MDTLLDIFLFRLIGSMVIPVILSVLVTEYMRTVRELRKLKHE